VAALLVLELLQKLRVDVASAHCSQFSAKLLDFLLELPQHGVLGVFVDFGFVLDVFGSVGLPQGADGFVLVNAGRAQVGAHDSAGVASQRVLKDSS